MEKRAVTNVSQAELAQQVHALACRLVIALTGGGSRAIPARTTAAGKVVVIPDAHVTALSKRSPEREVRKL